VKILVTGPPNSGKKTVAATLNHECVVASRMDVEEMILQHSKFDAAIIVVDAGHLCEGIFSYTALAGVLGVEPIISVLNKMDAIDYCQTQYVAMSQVLGRCIPRGLKEIEWYDGRTIEECLAN